MIKLKSAFVAIALLFGNCGSVLAQDKIVVTFPGMTSEPVDIIIVITDLEAKPPVNSFTFKALLPYSKAYTVSKKAIFLADSVPKHSYRITRNGKLCMEVAGMLNGKPSGYICAGRI
jgi:hypothetical protein